MQDDPPSIQATFARRVAGCVGAEAIADLAASGWHGIDAALSPIIGQQGAAALYKRSLYLTRTAHPCLGPVFQGDVLPGRYDRLRMALSAQTVAVAAAANGALLQNFHDLLATLIGESLTGQLLRPALDISFGDPLSDGITVQEPTP